MRWAKLLGVAGVVAVLGVTGAVVIRQRRRREWADLPPDELRSRLHERLDEARLDEARLDESSTARSRQL